MTRSQIYAPQVAAVSCWHDIRGIRYHVCEWGDRDQPLLVLLHGWGDCAASFQFLVDQFKDDWFVIAPDWRGFGQTRHCAAGYWFPDYVADLDVLLSIYQAEQPVDVLGHSMGANIAGLYAGIFPERVRAFVNVEGFGLADGDPARAPETYRRWIEQSRDMPTYSNYRSFDDLAERILRRSARMGRDKAMFIARSWAAEDETGTIVLRADPAHKLPRAVQYRRAEAAACWDNVAAEVLLVLGEETQFTAGKHSWVDADVSLHPFRGARTAVIPQAGHMVHFECPVELAAVTEAFVRNA